MTTTPARRRHRLRLATMAAAASVVGVVPSVAPAGAATADSGGGRNGYSQVPVTPKGLNATNAGETVLLDGALYYGGYGLGDDSEGGELWRTTLDEDGNGGTTELVDDIDPGPRSSDPGYLTPFGDDLFFAAKQKSTGKELWRYDSTTGETERLTDFDDGPVTTTPQNPNPDEPDGSSSPEDITPVGDDLYFTADHGAERRNLYVLDPGSSEIEMVGSDGAGPRDPRDLTVLDGQLYFSASDPTSGTGYSRQLWHTDPGTGTTEVVSDVPPRALLVVGPWLYFARDDDQHGDELWRYDTATEQAELVIDLAPPGVSAGVGRELIRAGRWVYFGADDGTHGSELWRSDSTTGVTEMVDDLAPGEKSSLPLWVTRAHHFVYFNADDGQTGAELWRTSVRTGRTNQVADLNPGPRNSFPTDLYAFRGTLYFSASRTNRPPYKLWATDARTGDTVVALGGAQGQWASGVYSIQGRPYYDGLNDLRTHRLIPPRHG